MMHSVTMRLLLSTTLTASLLAIAAVAQPGGGAPLCCKHSYSWPLGESDCGGIDGLAEVCEEGSSSATPDNPLARKTGASRPALCYTYNVGPLGFFSRSPCDSVPCYNAKLVGTLSDGGCCFACGGAGVVTVTSFPHPDMFNVSDCVVNDCVDEQ